MYSGTTAEWDIIYAYHFLILNLLSMKCNSTQVD
jgi:hypothetical protein